MKIALAVVLVLAVLIVGFAVIGGEDEDTQAITLEQFNSVKVGVARQEVEDKLGAPANRKELARIGIELPKEGPSACTYYPEEGKDLGEGQTFQFCFTDDKLGYKKVNALP